MVIKTSTFREKIEIIMHIFPHFGAKWHVCIVVIERSIHIHTHTQKKYNSLFFVGIPRETSELYLDVNEITAIDTNRLKHLKSLSRL